MADPKEEISRLKAKLRKANANHEEMVSMWAQQEAEVQKEAEDATRALKETRQELQATKGQLRKLEQKGEGPSAIAAATATAAALQEQLAKLEAERTKQVEALATEISSTKDQLRRCVASKTEVEAELGQSKEALEAAETRAARFEISLEDAVSAGDAARAAATLAEAGTIEAQATAATMAGQLEEVTKRATEAEGKLCAASEGAASALANEEAAKAELVAAAAELRNTRATLEDQHMEFKISKRRSGQMAKELKEQLKKETKAREALEREVKRMERAMLLQAEEVMREQQQQQQQQQHEQEGLEEEDVISQTRESAKKGGNNGSGSGGHAFMTPNRGSSDGESSNSSNSIARVRLSSEKFLTPQRKHSSSSSSSKAAPSSATTAATAAVAAAAAAAAAASASSASASSASPATVKVPSSKSERDLCSELAKRLEALLGENATVRGRVAFLEEEVRDLSEDLDRRRALCQQLLKPVSAHEAGGQLFRAAYRSAGGSHADAATTLLDPVAMDAKVKALIGAVRGLAPTSNNSAANPSPAAPAAASAVAASGGDTITTAGAGGVFDRGSATVAVAAGAGPTRPLLSFSLTPEESLLEVTLRENLQLRQRLAVLQPPPRPPPPPTSTTTTTHADDKDIEGRGEGGEGCGGGGDDDDDGGGGGGGGEKGVLGGNGFGWPPVSLIQSPGNVSEGLTTLFSRIKEKAADVKESLSSPVPVPGRGHAATDEGESPAARSDTRPRYARGPTRRKLGGDDGGEEEESV